MIIYARIGSLGPNSNTLIQIYRVLCRAMMYALLIPFRSLLAEIDVMRPIAAALWQLQPNLEWSRAMLCRLCSVNFTRKSVVFVEDEVRMSEQPRKMQVATIRLNVPEQYMPPQWFKTASPKDVASALSIIPSLVPILKGDLTQGLHIHQQVSEAIASVRQEAQKEKENQLNRHEEALQKLASSHVEQMSKVEGMMESRISELTKQRDDALKDFRLLKQQAASGARGLVDLQSIGKAVKRAGYEVCDAEDEYILVKRDTSSCLISTSGVTSLPNVESLADAAVFICSKVDGPRLEMRKDKTGRDRLPVTCLPDSPNADVLLNTLDMLFHFLTAVDRITPCEGITNEEQDILQTHFLDLSAHVREMFEVYSEQQMYLSQLGTSLTQARAKTMAWYRSSKRTAQSLPWSDVDMQLPFEAAYEHCMGRKWNNCTEQKMKELQKGIGKDAAALAMAVEPAAATPTVEKSSPKSQKRQRVSSSTCMGDVASNQ